jgi:hypothetical protein
LKKRGLRISSVLTDLEDGLILIQLAEILSSRTISSYCKNPRVIPQKLSNLAVVLQVFQQEGVRVGAVGPKAIQSGDPKSILGLLWQLILHYQLGSNPVAKTPEPTSFLPRAAAEADLDTLENELARLEGDQPPPPAPEYKPPQARPRNGTLFRTRASSPDTAKVNCLKCDKPLESGTVVTIDSVARYHWDCFVCVVCGCQFEESYWEHEGKPYCSDHFFEKAGQRCAKCKDYIYEQVVKAMDATWHFECFVCSSCGQPFDENYYTVDGKPYCKQDYYRKKGWLCGKCDQLVKSGDKSALGKAWHRSCFVCTECNEPFDERGFFGWQGFPYCPTHYKEKKAWFGPSGVS